MNAEKFICKICGGIDTRVVYNGPIRLGKFGNISIEHYCLRQCNSCHVIALPPIIENIAPYYESQTYRYEIDGGGEVADYFRLHDAEQLRHLKITGTSEFRDKTVADIGCGGGAFLDNIKGYAKLAIAIEPSEVFRASLSKRGYIPCAYVEDALHDYKNKVDIAVSFSVLEHVDDPLLFLKQIYMLLLPNGKLILSTPNSDDVLLQALPDGYSQFFYRKTHLWYFNSSSLSKLLEFAGFKEIKIIPYHRFGIANFLAWLKDKAPKGELQMDFITQAIDATWKAELERTFRCDYLYAKAVT
jgi:2-polyprenyl-3-methyl-5-hydroxy-6-metoxy-1,4-benzoquinol methylase